MSGLRRLAREMAREISFQGTGANKLFRPAFEKIWRENGGHPECIRYSHTKKIVIKAGRKKGFPMHYFKPAAR